MILIKHPENLSITAISEGDMSVGIGSIDVHLDTNILSKDFGKKELQIIKKNFKQFLEENFDDKFDDIWANVECPDCEEILNQEDGTCHTKGCPSNHGCKCGAHKDNIYTEDGEWKCKICNMVDTL
jgi:hypothetical protein